MSGGIASVAAVGTPSIRTKACLSRFHLGAAVRYALAASTLEEQHQGPDCLNEEHRHHCLAALLSIVAFLESAINECYQAVADGDARVAPLDATTTAGLLRAWRAHDFPKPPDTKIVRKYETALKIAGKPSLPYGDLELLIRVRNRATHYEPEWHPTGTTSQTLEAAFVALSISPSRFYEHSPNNPFFPDRCLGYDLLRWGINASANYAVQFFDTLGVEAPFVLPGGLPLAPR